MSREQFEQASKNLYEKMAADGVKGIMQYKPFSDDYWVQSPKIVVCNYENIGYHDLDKPTLLTYEHFRGWFDERINKIRSRTVHYTVVFSNCLQKIVRDFGKNSLMTEKDLRNSYKKYDELYQSMKNVMYMNLRPTSATGNKQEVGETRKIIHEYKNEMRVYLEALDANIFVLSTKDAVGLFNFIFDIKDKPLFFKKAQRVNNMLVFSIKHFRCSNYKYWYNKALEIANVWFHEASG
jgi:hypothetical protein